MNIALQALAGIAAAAALVIGVAAVADGQPTPPPQSPTEMNHVNRR